ncbi:hypothetical protein [Streptomyces sp. NPDC055085]
MRANGDLTQYLDLALLFSLASDDPGPADGENTTTRWFPHHGLPHMSQAMVAHIATALPDESAARFSFRRDRSSESGGGSGAMSTAEISEYLPIYDRLVKECGDVLSETRKIAEQAQARGVS